MTNCAYMPRSRRRVCDLGRFGGAPSADDCLACTDYRGPVRGAGDVVAAGARITGIDKIAGALGCNCGPRCGKLNRAMPINRGE